jgi:hypothetical protein
MKAILFKDGFFCFLIRSVTLSGVEGLVLIGSSK